MTRSILLISCGLALASCGGGGGTVVNPATAFRSNVVGDAWNYQLSTFNFGVYGTYSGTLSEALTSDTYAGAPSVRDTETFNLNFQTGPGSISSYSELSPEGQLLAEENDSAQLTKVASDTFNLTTPLSLSTNASGVITLADGTTYAIHYKIVGATALSTANGVFNCWVVKESVVHSGGKTDAYTLWVAPETGNYVQISDTTVNSDGASYQYTASLTSIVTPAGGAIRPGHGVIPFLGVRVSSAK